MKGDIVVLSKNTRRCVRRKEEKTEQWEDKSPYIHRSPYPTSIVIKFPIPLPFPPYYIVPTEFSFSDIINHK
jgi:hypothetical protein